MSLQSQLSNFAVRQGTEFKKVYGQIGVLGSLTTADKSTIVAAINEIKAGMGSAGAAINDAAASNTTTYSSNKTVSLLNLKADLASPTFTGTVSGITKSMVGLANVDNTSDANKPVSTATATALGLKAPLASPAFTGTVTGITAAMVGLGNVNNTSDANKPISTAQAAVNAAKADLVGGVVPTSQLPAIALGTVVTVASQAAMLALTSAQVQQGDVASRTDGAGTFMLTAADPSVLGNWTLLNAPTDKVVSVNGQVGTVLLGKVDIGLDQVDNTSDANKPISNAQGAVNAARLRIDAAQGLTAAQKQFGRDNLDVYGKTEIGDPETNLVTIFENALV